MKRNISEQLNRIDQDLKLFINRNVGTRRSFLLFWIKFFEDRCHSKQAVKVCALTGVAASSVGETKLHSTHQIPVQEH